MEEKHEQEIYDEVEIEDMEFDQERQVFLYPCPCGDKFFISLVFSMISNKINFNSQI